MDPKEFHRRYEPLEPPECVQDIGDEETEEQCDEEARFRCFTCGDYLCPDCAEYHHPATCGEPTKETPDAK